MPPCLILTMLCTVAGFCAAELSLNAAELSSAPGADLFNSSHVLRLSLDIAPGELNELRRDARQYVNATAREGAQRFASVAVHLKGATGSFRGLDDKPSFTLSFDRFVPSQRFHGLRKVHLNNSVEDPSYLNELLGGELFRSAGIPAARVTHALVELNGRALGLYALKEAFTEDFLALHFGDANGFLFEPGTGHDVNEALEQKLGDGTKGRASLDALASAAREPNLPQRWQRLPQMLDVERFISFMALEVMLAHRDGYCLARNNFRVAGDSTASRVVFMPHGMDQLFGNSPPMIEPRMSGLVARAVLETPKGREQYRKQFESLFTNLFAPEKLNRRIEELSQKLRPVLPSAETRAFKNAVADLKLRLATRHRDVQRLLASPELQPLQFHDGVAALGAWRIVDEPASGDMRQVQSNGGKRELYIRAGPSTAASWRTTVHLAPGRYRFEGAVRTAQIEPLAFGKAQGAALLVRRQTLVRGTPAPATYHGETLRVEFDMDTLEDVELGCELRARRGEAWFDVSSLRLVCLSQK